MQRFAIHACAERTSDSKTLMIIMQECRELNTITGIQSGHIIDNQLLPRRWLSLRREAKSGDTPQYNCFGCKT